MKVLFGWTSQISGILRLFPGNFRRREDVKPVDRDRDGIAAVYVNDPLQERAAVVKAPDFLVRKPSGAHRMFVLGFLNHAAGGSPREHEPYPAGSGSSPLINVQQPGQLGWQARLLPDLPDGGLQDRFARQPPAAGKRPLAAAGRGGFPDQEQFAVPFDYGERDEQA
jgi:hypothetical protein